MTTPTSPLPSPQPLPPPTGAAATEEVGPARLTHPVALFAVAFGIAVMIAVALGIGVGLVAFWASASSCGPSDAWCGLGAAFLGVLAGGLVALIAYVVTGVSIVFRHRPPGDRATPIAAHLAAPPAMFVMLSIASTLTESLGGAG